MYDPFDSIKIAFTECFAAYKIIRIYCRKFFKMQIYKREKSENSYSHPHETTTISSLVYMAVHMYIKYAYAPQLTMGLYPDESIIRLKISKV